MTEFVQGELFSDSRKMDEPAEVVETREEPRKETEVVKEERQLPELPADAPFNFNLVTATDEEIETLNEKYEFKGARAYEPTEKAIARLKGARSAADSRLFSWLHHPDDRVVMALMEDSTFGNKGWGKASELIGGAVTARGIHRATTDNVLWNPILDRAAKTGNWGTYYRGSVDYDTHEEGKLDGFPKHGPSTTPTKQAEKLIPWIKKQKDPNVFEHLLRFEHRTIREQVFQNAECLTIDFIRKALEETPGIGSYIAKNRSLTQEQIRWLFEWGVQEIDDADGRQESEDDNHLSWWQGRGGPVLESLERMGRDLPADLRERLLEITKRPMKEKVSSARYAWRVLSNKVDEMDEEGLLQMAKTYDKNVWGIEKICKAPAATPAVWLAALKATPKASLRRWMAEQPQALEDPDVCAALERSSQLKVIDKVIEKSEGKKFRKMFRKVATKSPARAVEILDSEEQDRKVREDLEKEDLVPILRGEDKEARVRAVTAMGHVGSDKKDQTEKKKKKKKKGRGR